MPYGLFCVMFQSTKLLWQAFIRLLLLKDVKIHHKGYNEENNFMDCFFTFWKKGQYDVVVRKQAELEDK